MDQDVQAIGEQAGGHEPQRALLTRIHQAAIDAVRGEMLIRANARVDGDAWGYERVDQHVVWPLDPKGSVFATCT